MQSNITRKAVPTRLPLLYAGLMAAMLITLWAVGYAQAIPFVIPFSLIIGGPLMNFLTYEIRDEKEQSVAAQAPASDPAPTKLTPNTTAHAA